MPGVVVRRKGSKPSVFSTLPSNTLAGFSMNGPAVLRMRENAVASFARPKENPLEHEGYRRLVAQFDCIHCGRKKRSQAAHVPPDGKAMKRDDRLTFPMCADGPGQKVGCHTLFDQYKLFPRAQAVKQGMKWAKTVRGWIRDMGQWPKKLEHWPGEEPKKPTKQGAKR